MWCLRKTSQNPLCNTDKGRELGVAVRGERETHVGVQGRKGGTGVVA